MIDDEEADDKIIAVLANDNLYTDVRDIEDLPEIIVERLTHYLTTYKLKPGLESGVIIDNVYGRDHAFEVVQATLTDYSERFGE